MSIHTLGSQCVFRRRIRISRPQCAVHACSGRTLTFRSCVEHNSTARRYEAGTHIRETSGVRHPRCFGGYLQWHAPPYYASTLWVVDEICTCSYSYSACLRRIVSLTCAGACSLGMSARVPHSLFANLGLGLDIALAVRAPVSGTLTYRVCCLSWPAVRGPTSRRPSQRPIDGQIWCDLEDGDASAG